jgi:NAD(P)-dependent dehydrogenase (short-subunit alcohol dehydrogenase family)
VSLLLAEEGANVVVNDYGVAVDGTKPDSGPAAEVAEEIRAKGGKAEPNFDTVATVEGGESLVKTALDTFGRLDILINVAGILRDRMIFNMSEDDWDAVLAVHLKGTFNVTRAASVVFRQQRSGVIVNTSSESGLGNMGQANYSAAKEGIVGFTRTVARDLGRYGVRCNAIRPRAATRLVISDEMREAAQRGGGAAGMNMDVLKAFEKANPPEAVAPLVVWLCTDEAANINGRNFLVAGNQIGLYSEPQVIADIKLDHIVTLDELSELMPANVTKDLVNQWVPKE